jgi:hypothetical protein
MGQKKEYQWKEDKVYIKDPITENGKCSVSLHVKDSAGNEKQVKKYSFFMTHKNQ